jgi:hypothetical protein
MSAAAFRAAVETWNLEAIGELLAEDVVFHSPVTHHPFVGRKAVQTLLECVAQTLEDFRYTDELAGPDGAHALVFRARVGDRDLEGIDLLRFDAAGAIVDFTVLVRPLSGLVPFAQAMGERIAAAGIAPTRT